ncbi:hypothetical protein R84B8_02879 [Treponema sp. R8-4-B8]
MKRSIIIIMTFCVIGLIGCNKQSQQNPVNITANFGNGSAMPSQTVEGDKSDVKVDTNAVISPNNPNNDPVKPNLAPLPFAGWNAWDDGEIIISGGTASNECILNTNGILPDAAGIVNAKLSTALRDKTIVLYFTNTRASNFSDGLMVKVECDNRVMQPSANALPIRGFLPAGDTPPDKGIEFTIPNTFNGKLNFVFYQSTLKDLKITAYYK